MNSCEAINDNLFGVEDIGSCKSYIPFKVWKDLTKLKYFGKRSTVDDYSRRKKENNKASYYITYRFADFISRCDERIESKRKERSMNSTRREV